MKRKAMVVCATLILGLAASAQQTPTTPSDTPTGSSGNGGGVSDTARNQTRIDTRSSSTTSDVSLGDEASSVEAMVGDDRGRSARGTGGPRAVSGAGQGTGVGFVGEGGKFEPFLKHKIEYGPVPEGGDVLDLGTAEGEMPAIQFIDTLQLATGWNILVTEEVNSIKLRFWLTQMTPQQALEVLRFNGIYYEYNPETTFLYFMTKEEYLRGAYGGPIRADFKIQHANLTDMQAILENVASPEARIITDLRTGSIIVWDTQDNVNEMMTLVGKVDVPIEPRRFSLTHVNAEDVVDSLSDLLTESGTAFSDPRTNTIIVEDLPHRMERIAEFIKTLDVELDTRTWTLNYIEAEEVSERIELLVPEEMGEIIIDEEVHQITVTGIPQRLDEIDKLIKVWDIKKRQVEIEAYLVAASRDIERELGIDWSYFGAQDGEPIWLTSGALPGTSPSAGNGAQIGALPYSVDLTQTRVDWSQIPENSLLPSGSIRDLLDEIRAGNILSSQTVRDSGNSDVIDTVLRRGGIAMVLNYLDKTGKASILSSPRVVVQDGEEALMENTENIPYQDGGSPGYGLDSGTGAGTGVGANLGFYSSYRYPTTKFEPVGTILKVSPTIAADSNILLEVDVEDSTAEIKRLISGGLESDIPQKRESHTSTSVLVHDRQTIVIAGLRNATQSDDVEKIPILGDLPIMSRLFRNTKKSNRERSLFVFITPTLVDEYTQPEADQLAQFDEQFREGIREGEKGFFGRMNTTITKGENEIGISVGQSGELFSEGKRVELTELEQRFAGAKSGVLVVIRPHPRAPKEVVDAIVKRAEDAGLKHEIEDNVIPFVPAQRVEPQAVKAAE